MKKLYFILFTIILCNSSVNAQNLIFKSLDYLSKSKTVITFTVISWGMNDAFCDGYHHNLAYGGVGYSWVHTGNWHNYKNARDISLVSFATLMTWSVARGHTSFWKSVKEGLGYLSLRHVVFEKVHVGMRSGNMFNYSKEFNSRRWVIPTIKKEYPYISEVYMSGEGLKGIALDISSYLFYDLTVKPKYRFTDLVKKVF